MSLVNPNPLTLQRFDIVNESTGELYATVDATSSEDAAEVASNIWDIPWEGAIAVPEDHRAGGCAEWLAGDGDPEKCPCGRWRQDGDVCVRITNVDALMDVVRAFGFFVEEDEIRDLAEFLDARGVKAGEPR